MEGRSKEWSWYARAGAGARSALRGLRVEADIEWVVGDGALWLRGRSSSTASSTASSTDLAPRLALGGAVLLRPVARGGLVRAHPEGLAVPTDQIPGGDWRPADELVEVSVPPPALAGRLEHPLALGVVRGGPPRPAAGLRLPLAELVDWAGHAPEARLEALEFAADASGEAFVVGAPLPPIGGELFWQEAGVFVPAGFRLEPDVSGEVARAALVAGHAEGTGGDRFLVDPRGASRLTVGAFVPAGRSALRTTLVEVHAP